MINKKLIKVSVESGENGFVLGFWKAGDENVRYIHEYFADMTQLLNDRLLFLLCEKPLRAEIGIAGDPNMSKLITRTMSIEAEGVQNGFVLRFVNSMPYNDMTVHKRIGDLLIELNRVLLTAFYEKSSGAQGEYYGEVAVEIRDDTE